TEPLACWEVAGLTSTFKLPWLPVPVSGDATRLSQVIGNLLNNAVKFTQRDGRVELRVDLETTSARVGERESGRTGEGAQAVEPAESQAARPEGDFTPRPSPFALRPSDREGGAPAEPLGAPPAAPGP